MTLATSGAARAAYVRDSVASASPSHVITMLYDRLLLDLRWGEKAQTEGDWYNTTKHLTHAQAIITELSSSLKPELWDGGPALMSLYFYVLQILRTGNAARDVERTREAIELLDPLRLAWHAAEESVAPQPTYTSLSAVG
jgi:flagellar protein FliS